MHKKLIGPTVAAMDRPISSPRIKKLRSIVFSYCKMLMEMNKKSRQTSQRSGDSLLLLLLRECRACKQNQTSVRPGLPAGFELLCNIENHTCLRIYFSIVYIIQMSWKGLG